MSLTNHGQPVAPAEEHDQNWVDPAFEVDLRATPDAAASGWVARWKDIPRDEWTQQFHQLPDGEDDELFLALPSEDQAALLLMLPPVERRIWVRALAPDDAADVIQVVPPADRGELLALLDDASRREVAALLAYAEDRAGGLMSPRFARLRPEMSVGEAIRYLRQQANAGLELLYYAYVLDPQQHLIGVVSFRDLFGARDSAPISEVMTRDVLCISAEMDQEEVAKIVAMHDLLALPVVNAENVMVGIITVDDIVDVVQEEASEDIHKLGGLEALDLPYLQTPFREMMRKRAGWLAVLFAGELLTATAMTAYEAEIEKAVVLAVFVPLIISSGGNSGSQATSLVIRALALGEIQWADAKQVLARELMSGLGLGAILGLLGVLRVVGSEWLFGGYGDEAVAIALTVGVSLLGVVVWGTLAGSFLPLVIRRIGFDPATASAPFVATLVDVTGLVIYFSVAQILLAGTLL